jgi:hypothetical protein
MQPMIDIVNLLKYPIDKGVNAHLSRTKTLLSVLAGFKKLTTSQKRSFKEAIRCIYQNSI